MKTPQAMFEAFFCELTMPIEVHIRITFSGT
jgi:hypothetical protein